MRLDRTLDDIYAYVMERTTVYFDATLKRRLKEAASRSGTTEASILREALERYLADAQRPTVRPVGTSRDGGVAHRVDEALRETGFGER